MPKNKKKYDDDDGRTIADMSDVTRQPLIVPRFDRLSKKERQLLNNEEHKSDNPWENNKISKEERRALVTGALGATLAIASVFIVAAAILIFLILKVWG